ncbi:MAG: 30S ribosomal protein S10 [Spirochaetes bacterium]|jgi:small subunit ribosomal protein S10|nr:30S ribosomal protein S10 [Spirochaetota bacterium]
MAGQRVRIKLKSFDSKAIDVSAQTIVDSAKRSGAKIAGPIPLPTRIRKVTVNRSVHVHVTSREQFEMRTYKRMIDIYDTTAETMNSLMNIELPAGVYIEIKQ